jgi:hypothetical protein
VKKWPYGIEKRSEVTTAKKEHSRLAWVMLMSLGGGIGECLCFMGFGMEEGQIISGIWTFLAIARTKIHSIAPSNVDHHQIVLEKLLGK